VTPWSRRIAAVAILLGAVGLPPPAGAVSPYSRKYATSCITCHTVYPKLTPFGEAFRRNGMRFPGAVDSDYIKQEVVALGQEASKKDFPKMVWPSFMTSIPSLGFGVNGRIGIHPTTGSTAARADNRTVFSLDRLMGGGTLFVAGPIDDNLQAYAAAAFSDTGASLEHAEVTWSDVVGPRHLVNLVVGNSGPTLSAFARTSTYAGGRTVFGLTMTSLYGGKNGAFRVSNRYNLLELNGSAWGRLGYSLGINSGVHVGGTAPAENFYGSLFLKLGGWRLDGEGGTIASSADKPWAENSFTVHGFGYRSATRFNSPLYAATAPGVRDMATTLGGGFRAQWGSLELNASALREEHSHVTAVAGPDGRPGAARQIAYAAELSYVIYPWLVPAVRGEHALIVPASGKSADHSRILPAVAMLLRPNLKVSVTAVVERASGQAAGGASWKGSGDGLTVDPAFSAGVKPQLASATVSASFLF